VFRDELDRIWSRTWVYIGHESEIAQPGDYVTRTIGLVPVIMSRGQSGQVRLLVNQCRHRGNTVCQDPAGNATVFRCAYHGWCYTNDGALVGATFPTGYGPEFDKADYGLLPVARVESYNGFVFGSLAGSGDDLLAHLGRAREYLDQFVSFSPEREIVLSAGAIKSRLMGNWKMPMENAVDGYHPAFLHRSVMDRAGSDAKVAEATVHSCDLGNGHAALDFRMSNRVTGAGATESRVQVSSIPPELAPANEEHQRLLEGSYGTERAHEIWGDGLSNVSVFPNLALVRGDVRIIVPVNAGETLMYQFPAAFKGAPEVVNRERIRWEVAAYGAAGMVGSDDAEAYERTQEGYRANGGTWALLSRGMAIEDADELGVLRSGLSDETAQRAFWRGYLEYMSRA
jgi:phenylpropionate dioxygenase-like ring-hydroxylating dioxygenase large terminal subunit